MQVKELKSEGLSHEMEVTISANDIDERVGVRLKEVGQTVRMPGFRPGKIPMNILKKRYGKAIMGEILEAAVNETSSKIIQDKKLRPAMQPKIEVKSFDDGKDLTYTMSVETLPEFDVMDFKKIKLERLIAKPDAKAVNEALERLAENAQTTQEITTKRGAKDGDTVVIDFSGRTADDNVEHEGMQADGHSLKLGSGQFIPGFEGQLVGKKKGDKVEVKVSFPEEYGAAELAGRDAIFDVEIHEIREPSDAKIDDDLAKSFGMEDLAALKKGIEEQVGQEMTTHSRMVLKKSLLDALDDGHSFKIPEGMLELEHTNIIDQLELDRQRHPEEGGEKLSDKEKAEYKDIAERRVRLGLILNEVGHSNNLMVPDAELQKSVISEAQKYPGQEKEVFDYYSKNPQALESLRAPLFEDKVVDYILELADVQEKEVSAKELASAFEDDDEDEKPKKKSTAKKSSAKKAAPKKTEDKKAPAKKKSAAKKATKAKKAS